MRSESPPNEEYAFFHTTSWCRDLLLDPNLQTFVPSSRTIKADTEDSLFARTLNSGSSTISHCLAFHPRPHPHTETIPYLSLLLALGEDMNGFAGILHGGIVAALLDEAMGVLLTRNDDLSHVRAVGQGKRDGEFAETLGQYTVQLNVKYKGPIKTPGFVLARAEFVRKEGRKVWIKAIIQQKEHKGGEGELVTCAEGEGVFVEPRAGKL